MTTSASCSIEPDSRRSESCGRWSPPGFRERGLAATKRAPARRVLWRSPLVPAKSTKLPASDSRSACSRRHQLQIVHHQQIESSLRLLQPPRLGPHFAQRDPGESSIKSMDLESSSMARTIFFMSSPTANRCASCARRQSRANTATVAAAPRSTFPARRCRPPCRRRWRHSRNVHGKRGLAHRRPRRQNDQVRLLETAGLLVEIGVVRGQPGNALPALQQGVDRSERVADNLLDP